MSQTHSAKPLALSAAGRYLILVVAFLGWLFAGVHMSITQLAGQPAAIDLLEQAGDLDAARYFYLNKQTQAKQTLLGADKTDFDAWKPTVARWFAWLQCSFLFGAATGGLVFGWLGDRMGRSKAMALSIATYSLLAAAASFAQAPWQLCLMWYLACTGVGGMWPNGVALVSEAWTGMSRPMVAGVIGVAANIGIFLLSTLARYVAIHSDQWRWVMLLGAAPTLLGVLAWFIVPESPRWLATRVAATDIGKPTADSVFHPPLLTITLIAIVLATIPMIGGWGTANWMNPWASEAGGPALMASVLQWRSLTGIAGSLLGGWIANLAGRRWTYFAVSLASLAVAQYIFVWLTPRDESFLFWVAVLGFISGIYFGWLPLCLPELFPTRHRATGAGVGFNFGRIVTAMTIFASGALMTLFEGKYEQIGRYTSLLFVLGMIVIWFAPDMRNKDLAD
jgi:MFS transporter, SHS family, sialic acid transporter